jgi:abnormal spindle-like microcephaly-associated protein
MVSLARENAQMLQNQAMVAGVIGLQHVARVWLEKKVISAVLIQSCYRKHSLHEKFLSKKQLATRIQTEERRRQCAAKYARVLRGALLLQAHYRGFLTRRVLLRRTETEKAAAAFIQAYYRGFFLRQHFLTLKLSSVRIQHCLQHTAMDTRVLRGTIRLQTHHRGFLTRWILSRRAETEEAATVVIQSFCRSAVLRQNFLMLKQIAVRIQAVERRRQCVTMYARLRRGSIFVQGLHRAFTARRMLLRLAETEEAKEAGAIVIQAYYRGFSLCQHFLTLREIAVRIQTAERRRQQRANYSLAVRGTIRLQAHHRGFSTRRMLTRRVEAEERAAAVIQTFYRGFFLRQEFSVVKQVTIRIQAAERRRQSVSSYAVVVCGTVRLQALHLGFLTRQMLARVAEMEEAAAVIIQTSYRGLFLRQYFLRLKQITIRLQAAERCRQCTTIYTRVLRGTISLQAHFRGFLTRWILSRRLETEEAAAVDIQRVFRSIVLRQNFLMLKQIAVRIQAVERRRQCVTKYAHLRRGISGVQALHRAFMARQVLVRLAETEKVKEAGAIVIQTYYRGLSLCQHFSTLKQSAVQIQAAERRRQHTANYSLALRAAIRLQAHHRSFLTRRLLLRRAKTEEVAAIAIQTFYRRFFLRHKFVAVKQATIRIQAVGRRRHSLSNYSVALSGTVRLQALHRGFLTRLMLVRRAKTEEKASVIVQTYYRRLFLRQHFLTLKQSVVRIQWAERRRQHRANYSLAVRGTVRLQAHQRGFLTRRMSARRVEAEEAATAVIQTSYRGFVLRQKLLALEQVAIRIQAAERRRQSLSNFSVVLCGMVRLQAIHRGFLARLGLARRAEMEKAAAVTIQSYCKSFACRQTLLMRRRAAVRIQALERRRLSLSKYAVILASIVRLQEQYRGFQIRRLITELAAAAVIIQSCYRGFVSRRIFLTCRAVVVRVQAMARRRHWLPQYLNITRGIVRLQAVYRRFSVKRWLRLQAKAARIIQVCWRVSLEDRRFRDPIHSAAAKRIQVAYFTWKMQATLLMVESSVVLLQRSVRGQLLRSAARFALSHINVSFRSTTLVSFARITNDLDPSVVSINRAWSKAVVLAREAACIVMQSALRRMLAILYSTELRKRSGLPALRQFVNKNAASAFKSIKSVSSSLSSTGRRKGQRGATKHRGLKLSSATGAREKPADVVSEPERRADRYCSARVIQRAFRKHSKRSSIRVHHAAACQVQRFYRQRSAMARYTISRTGVLCLQSQFRGACVRSEVAAMTSAVGCPQQMWRMNREHVGYRTIRDATLLIQQAFRSHAKRTSMRVNSVAACQLQKFYRQRWAIARYAIIRAGVICLQRQFRGGCVRSEVAAMSSAVAPLQKTWRMYRMGVIQANYRMRAASWAFDIHRNAAVAIQTVYRSWHGRKTYFDQIIYQEQLHRRLEKSIKSQANESSRKVVNRILDGNEASAGICVARLAHRFLSVAEKSKIMIAIASSEKQKGCRLSEDSSRPRNAAVDVNAGAEDVVTDDCIEEAVGNAAAAVAKDGQYTQLGTASKAKAPSVSPAASRLAINEPKKQVDREKETRERPASPSTLQLAMEAQQLLREARHARAIFQKTRSTAPTPKKCTIFSRNERTHQSVPPSK